MNTPLKHILMISAAVIGVAALQGCSERAPTVIGPDMAQGRYVCFAYNHRTKAYFRGISEISRRAARRHALARCRSFRFPNQCVMSGRRPCRIVGHHVRRGLYVCSVHNLKTGRLFVGRSPNRLRAISRARAHCARGRFSARCSVHVRCRWNRR